MKTKIISAAFVVMLILESCYFIPVEKQVQPESANFKKVFFISTIIGKDTTCSDVTKIPNIEVKYSISDNQLYLIATISKIPSVLILNKIQTLPGSESTYEFTDINTQEKGVLCIAESDTFHVLILVFADGKQIRLYSM